MGFDVSYVLTNLLTSVKYIPVTLEITISSVIFGLAAALLLAMGQLVHIRVINILCISFIALIRGTPMLLLIMLVYYGLPLVFMEFGVNINGLPQIWFAVLAISMNASAYMSESMRSAYLAVHHGQYEAGLSVGMGAGTVNRQIIIPQACVMALPNIGNQLISVLKHSSLVYAIGISDVFEKAQAAAMFKMGLKQVEVFVVITLIYWFISLLTELGVWLLERRFRHLIP
jgi:L-cystine transport system permease protein